MVQCAGLLLGLLVRAEGRQSYACRLAGFPLSSLHLSSQVPSTGQASDQICRVQVGQNSMHGTSTDGIFTDADSSLGEPVPASSATVEVGDEPSSWLGEEEPHAVPVRPTELSFDLLSQQGEQSRRAGRSRRQLRRKVQRGRVRPQNFTGGDSAEGCSESDSTCPQGRISA